MVGVSRRAFTAADRYYSSELLNPRNIRADGKWLPGGQKKITDAYLRMKALGTKLDQMAEGS